MILHIFGPFKRLVKIFLAMLAFFFIADIVYLGFVVWVLDHPGWVNSLSLVVGLPLLIILKILEFTYLLTFLPFIFISNNYYNQLTWDLPIRTIIDFVEGGFLSTIIITMLTIFIYAVILNIVINTIKSLPWFTKK